MRTKFETKIKCQELFLQNSTNSDEMREQKERKGKKKVVVTYFQQ